MAQREKKDRSGEILTSIMQRMGQSRLINKWSMGVKVSCMYNINLSVLDGQRPCP